MNAKKIKHDIYVFSEKKHQWVKVECTLPYGVQCKEPMTQPRGVKGGYNTKLTGQEETNAKFKLFLFERE